MAPSLDRLNILHTELQNLQNAFKTCFTGSATSYEDLHAIVQRVATCIANMETLRMDPANTELLKLVIEIQARHVQISHLVAEDKTDLIGRTALKLPQPSGSSWLTPRRVNPLKVEIMTEMANLGEMFKGKPATCSTSSIAPSAPPYEFAEDPTMGK